MTGNVQQRSLLFCIWTETGVFHRPCPEASVSSLCFMYKRETTETRSKKKCQMVLSEWQNLYSNVGRQRGSNCLTRRDQWKELGQNSTLAVSKHREEEWIRHNCPVLRQSYWNSPVMMINTQLICFNWAEPDSAQTANESPPIKHLPLRK